MSDLNLMDPETVRAAVRERYAAAATSGRCCGPTSSACCDDTAPADATAGTAFYSADELAGLSNEVATFSLGCGNPIAFAHPQPGETVLDLGSGGGLDCLIAARTVGPTGRVIGVDMTPAMLARAWDAAARMNVTNVEFRQGYIESLPVADDSVDLIISNCVINLSTDKDAVFREALRVLRPGGRLVVSDIVTASDLPDDVRRDLGLWAECIGGALAEHEYVAKMAAAGFEAIEPLARSTYDEGRGADSTSPNGPIYSLKLRAYKPG